MTYEEMVETFGEVISSYPDSQACEDGILVPITDDDRVTRACWEWLAAKLPEGNNPPSHWPVEMMGWFGAKDGDDKALAASKGLIGSWGRQARDAWANPELDGGLLSLQVLEHEGTIRAVSKLEVSGVGTLTTIWLIPNEVGGITLMFPSDY